MWQNKDNYLYKLFKFKDFSQAFTFMTRVAEVASDFDHHPKWLNEYNKVEIWLITHDDGDVTDKDHKLAGAIDRIYELYEDA